MVFFRGKPLVNIPSYDVDFTPQQTKSVLALLILEHGYALVRNGTAYELRSEIAKKGAYGNVVLEVKPNKSSISRNRIFSHPLDTASVKTARRITELSSKYGVTFRNLVTWTGNKSDDNTFTYAGFSSFNDFMTYIKKRLNLTKTSMTVTDSNLLSYSGGSVKYASLVKNLMNDISFISI